MQHIPMRPLKDLSSNLQGCKWRCRWDVVGCFLLSGKCHMYCIKKNWGIQSRHSRGWFSGSWESHGRLSTHRYLAKHLCSWRRAGWLWPLSHSMFSPAISRCRTAPIYLPSRADHLIAFQRTVLKSICFLQGFLIALWLPSFRFLVAAQVDFLI